MGNVVEKTQTEFNEELHEKYQESFWEEKLLIDFNKIGVKMTWNKTSTQMD